MNELADSINRLRDFEEKYLLAYGPARIARDAIRSAHFPEAIQTINQLVDLVAEMHKASMVVWKTNNPQTKEENEPLVELRELVTKAAPIAQLKEK